MDSIMDGVKREWVLRLLRSRELASAARTQAREDTPALRALLIGYAAEAEAEATRIAAILEKKYPVS